jgi:hypothetical protein
LEQRKEGESNQNRSFQQRGNGKALFGILALGLKSIGANNNKWDYFAGNIIVFLDAKNNIVFQQN